MGHRFDVNQAQQAENDRASARVSMLDVRYAPILLKKSGSKPKRIGSPA
jgi:hypothetical protein